MPGDTIGVCGVWILFWSFGCQSEVQPFKMSYLASLDSDVTLQKKNSLAAYVYGPGWPSCLSNVCVNYVILYREQSNEK